METLGYILFWFIIGLVCAVLFGQHFRNMRELSQEQDDAEQSAYLKRYTNNRMEA